MNDKIFFSYVAADQEYIPHILEEMKKRNLIRDEKVEILDHSKSLQTKNPLPEDFINLVKSASKVVIIRSKNSANSAWVNYEAGIAHALGKQIIIFEVQDSEKPDFMSNLTDYQHLHLEKAI